MRVLLLGHGRMGRLVEQLAPDYGATVTRVLTTSSAERVLSQEDVDADVAIDFTVPEAVPRNLPLLAGRGINTVVGTTGWSAHDAAMRELIARHDVGVLVAANFSLGMNIFQLVVEEAAKRFAKHQTFAAWIHERHHAAKKDAPSGTALQLMQAMRQSGYTRPIDVSYARVGSIPGTHEVGFDGPSDTITLTHAVRDRAVFARGALEAATWLVGKRGWFTMKDMLEAL